jgi:hypothetical protein
MAPDAAEAARGRAQLSGRHGKRPEVVTSIDDELRGLWTHRLNRMNWCGGHRRAQRGQGEVVIWADVGVFVLKPSASGSVSLRSADPLDLPLIDQAFLSNPGGADAALLVERIELTRALLRRPPLASAVVAELDGLRRDGEPLMQFAHRRVKATTIWLGAARCVRRVDATRIMRPPKWSSRLIQLSVWRVGRSRTR